MTERLVVVRTGYTPFNWYRQGKWSTPEQPLVQNNQIVRNLILQGIPVIVLFLGLGDTPLFLVKIHHVRTRDAILDAAYPYSNEYGPFLTFMTFNNNPIFAVVPELNFMFLPIINSIRFVPGQELLISEDQAHAPIVYYTSLIQILPYIQLPYMQLNTTYIV